MSIVLTRTQNIRPEGNLDKYEFRGSRYGQFDFVYRDGKAPGGILTREIERQYLEAIHSTVQVPVFKFDGSISLGSSRAITVSNAENTTDFVTISRNTISWGFKTYPTLFKNNHVGYQQDFEKKYIKFWNLVYATLDNLAGTMLTTYKSQAFNDILAPTYTNTGDVIVSSAADAENLIGDVNVIMEANDYFDKIHLVGNGGLQSLINRLAQKGTYNSENKRLQYLDKMLYYSNRIANDAGHRATFYAINEGSTGFVTGVDREAFARTRSQDKGREWDIITDPLFGFAVGAMYYEEDGDYNAIAGAASADMTASHAECWGFSFDYGFLNPYNSVIADRPNPIVKFAITNL